LYSSSSPISLFFAYNSTTISKYDVKSSHSISPCDNH
jgi:hypothetical protein